LTAAAPVAAPTKTLLGHPRGLFLLFFTEAWERVQYYGMRAFLVLYLVDKTRGLGWTDGQALAFYGWYTAFVFLTPVIGGWLADRYLGQRLSVAIGGTLMMVGQFLCALKSEPLLYVALVFLVVGNGFFKANISTMVGQLYGRGDPRRDSAFTIFYMGINLGGMIGPLICGTLAEKVDWSLGFASAGLGMALGVLIFLALKGRLLGEVGTFGYEQKKTAAGKVLTGPLTKEERDRVIVIFVIAFFVIAFWAAYEQAGGLMNLFTDRKIDRMLLGHEVPTTTFQSINSLFILLLAPPFAILWPWLAKRKKEPSTAAKMGFGLLQLAAGFLLLVAAARQAEVAGKAAAMWMVGAYFLHTTGELSLSPVGLSMVTKLAPKKLASALMGVWFLANFVGNKLAGVIGSMAEVYGEFRVFLGIAIGSAAAGVILLVIAPVLRRMTHGAESPVPPVEAGAAVAAG
jgi:POT family proton-dependent oligopeptide transporter